jgi:hypothetical protein
MKMCHLARSCHAGLCFHYRSYNYTGVSKSLRHARRVAIWLNTCRGCTWYSYIVFICYVHCGGRKIRLMEVNAKFRFLKKFTFKGNSRQVFISVYRLEIANFLHSAMLVFSTQLCDLSCTLPFSLVQLSPPSPSLCE